MYSSMESQLKGKERDSRCIVAKNVHHSPCGANRIRESRQAPVKFLGFRGFHSLPNLGSIRYVDEERQ